MRKALMLALCLGVASANAGLEGIATSSERISPIATDSRAIKSTSSGRIPVSGEVCKEFITQVPLLGKLAYLTGHSPYVYGTNKLGETTFQTEDTASTVTYMRDMFTKNTITKEVEMRGTRPYIADFKAYMRLECKPIGQEIEYNSTMYILIENGIRRFAVKGLRILPYTGDKIEQAFKTEQDSVGKMMERLVNEMRTKPEEVLRKAKESKELTDQEKIELEKSMIKHGFLK